MSSPPPVSIDEAIELFLAIACPGGVPEGVDRAALVEKLRERVAADRPEWAAASLPPKLVAPPEPQASYSQIKAAAVERARLAEIPTDPEERYLQDRRQEAQRNREQREEDAEETATRQRLIQNLLAEKRTEGAGPESTLRIPRGDTGDANVLAPEIDEKLLDRALRIRRLLVDRMQRSPALEVSAPASFDLDTPSPELSSGALSTDRDTPALRLDPRENVALTATPPSTWQEVAATARDLSPEEQAKIVRGFNEEKRAQLKKRESLFVEPRTSRQDVFSEPRPKRESFLSEPRPSPRRAAAEPRTARADLRIERDDRIETSSLRLSDKHNAKGLSFGENVPKRARGLRLE